MRFVIGLLLGFGIGLAGAVLFAPEKRGRAGETAAGEDATSDGLAFGENHDSMAALRRAFATIRRQLQEAWSEAREAANEAERDMIARYERSVSKQDR